jgi:cytochrome c oxidase subunit I
MAATTYPEQKAVAEPRGIASWITTVDHKRIGLMYIVTSFLFFVTGGILALIIRAELAFPGGQVRW